MNKRRPYRYVVCSNSRVSWQIIQAAWTLGIFLLLLLACAILSDLAWSNRMMLHPSHSPGAPLEAVPSSVPCRAIEINAPDGHIRETQQERPQVPSPGAMWAKKSEAS